MRFFFVITSIVLTTGLTLGQTKKQLKKYYNPTKRQQEKEAKNHNCVSTSKYSTEQLRKFYPFDIAKSVSIISFENDTSFTNTLPIVKGEVDYSQIKETKILNKEQIDSLASIFYNVTYSGEIMYLEGTGCYNPRNAVLFLDSNNHLVEFIELCFECYEQRFSSDRINIGDLCDQKSNMIKEFFFRMGIRVGTAKRTD